MLIIGTDFHSEKPSTRQEQRCWLVKSCLGAIWLDTSDSNWFTEQLVRARRRNAFKPTVCWRSAFKAGWHRPSAWAGRRGPPKVNNETTTVDWLQQLDLEDLSPLPGWVLISSSTPSSRSSSISSSSSSSSPSWTNQLVFSHHQWENYADSFLPLPTTNRFHRFVDGLLTRWIS